MFNLLFTIVYYCRTLGGSPDNLLLRPELASQPTFNCLFLFKLLLILFVIVCYRLLLLNWSLHCCHQSWRLNQHLIVQHFESIWLGFSVWWDPKSESDWFQDFLRLFGTKFIVGTEPMFNCQHFVSNSLWSPQLSSPL